MTKVELIEQQITELPAEEQLTLAQRVLERYTPPEDYELSPELREVLRERLAAAKENPAGGIPWEEVKAGILKTL
jgi:putative addiction module component (TIGR02574 family)